MNDGFSREWLVEIFIQYQEAIDYHRKSHSPMWLKDALESDRKNKSQVRNSASRLDAS